MALCDKPKYPRSVPYHVLSEREVCVVGGTHLGALAKKPNVPFHNSPV